MEAENKPTQNEPTQEELQQISWDVLNNIKTSLANKMIEVNLKDEWSNNFKQNRITSVFDEYISYVNDNIRPDIKSLSYEQLRMLGFGVWNNDTGLMLVPYWAVPFVEDTEVIGIDETTTMISKASGDNRFGCIPYGIIPEDFVPDVNYAVPESIG